MEIEFNTGRIGNREAGQPVTRPSTTATATATDSASFTSAATLERQLINVPTVRVDKVALAKTLITNPNYPPTELLDRIAALLAVHNLQ